MGAALLPKAGQLLRLKPLANTATCYWRIHSDTVFFKDVLVNILALVIGELHGSSSSRHTIP